MHAFIFPTAIRIETQNSAYQFTSFRSRSNTLDHLVKLLDNFKRKQENQSIRTEESLGPNNSGMNSFKKDTNSTSNARSMQSSDIWSEEEDLNESDDKDHDLTSELLSITDEDTNIDVNNKLRSGFSIPGKTCFNNFIAYDQYKKQENVDSNNKEFPFVNSCFKY
jgi:hypothetical protein